MTDKPLGASATPSGVIAARALIAVLVVSVIYYLCGAYVAGTWDCSRWEGIAKLLTLICLWLPASIFGIYIATGGRIQ